MLIDNITKNKLKNKIQSYNNKINNNFYDSDMYETDNYKIDTDIDTDTIYTKENITFIQESNMNVLQELNQNKNIIIPHLSSINKEEYNSLHKIYIYNLNNNILEYPSHSDTQKNKINFVIYKINNLNTYPFLLYLLYKLPQQNILTFFNIYSKKYILQEEIKNYMYNLFQNNNIPSYKGYRLYNNEYYLFFEYEIQNYNKNNTENYNEENIIYKDIKYIWTTIDEIVNLKKTLNFNIDTSITSFFLNNIDICNIYIIDPNTNIEKIVEIPITTYYSNNSFLYKFGIKRENTLNTFGPFYYFYDYNDVKNYKIIRILTFLGKTKIYINNPNINNIPYIDWINNFNSITLINKNQNIQQKYKYIIRDYNQIIPISVIEFN
jgi:hypothetical protein